MSFSEIAALFWRHKVLTGLVLAFTLMFAVYVKKSPPMYQESATVVFIGATKAPNPYAEFTGDLVATGYVVMQTLNGPASAEQIARAGGSAAYSVGMANGYNLEYPVYNEPYGTLATMSRSPAAVEQTFAVVSAQLGHILALQQAKVSPGSRVVAHFVGNTGLTVVPGSSKRVYAGILILSMVALFMIVGLVDRLPSRLNVVARVRRFAAGR
jgi:hypothetical protein